MTAETLLKELGQKIAKLTNSEGECVWCGFVFKNNLHAFDCPAASLLELPEGEPLDDSYSIRRTRKGNIADAILPLFVELLNAEVGLREREMRVALERIEHGETEGGGPCHCEHDDEDCCEKVDEYCPQCIAGAALAASVDASAAAEKLLAEARLEEAERVPHRKETCLMFNYDGTPSGLECSCYRGKRIAELRAALAASGDQKGQ